MPLKKTSRYCDLVNSLFFLIFDWRVLQIFTYSDSTIYDYNYGWLFQDWVDEEWQFIQEIGPLEDKKPLKQLLEATTFGKSLLEKQEQHLTPRERQAVVQLIVEHQLRILPSINDTIRQEVWSSWAKEICSQFKGEHPDV